MLLQCFGLDHACGHVLRRRPEGLNSLVSWGERQSTMDPAREGCGEFSKATPLAVAAPIYHSSEDQTSLHRVVLQ